MASGLLCSRINTKGVTDVEHVRNVVLVVEADPPVRELLSDLLKDEGYDVVTAYDGEAARRLVAARRVDVVAIDLDAPEAAASALLPWGRVMGAEPYIVALSSSQPPSREARQAHALVSKPFDVDELLSAVRRLLAARRMAERSARGRAYGVPERPALVSLPAAAR